ncbi:unnamed protein product [Nippostrongylus brasiliensis]|uniref:Mannosyltransferase n=1 Tax=Nippostrongylus brasiliensis TaxID=27835 RepID=A0A0N4Y2I9_NIPBR|nr:unnamed protein product [Nippostrongylus brasiliensis]
MANITNLNKPKDAFEQLEDEHGARQGFCHIRIQQRTGRKTITTVQGVGTEYDLKRIVRFLKKSWFVPDEVYQSSEVAHRAVFGTGHLSWEWKYGLRSPLHPALIAFIYKLLQKFGLDSHALVANAPRVFHAVLFSLGFHSFLPHKEQRFLLPIIPLLCFYAGPFFTVRRAGFRRLWLGIMLLLNVTLVVYCGLRHQVGPYNAADAVLAKASNQSNVSVAALMPCYSIPGHSYFHNGVNSIRMLDCSPSIGVGEESDEADKFHEDPEMWIDKNYNEIRSFSYILLYEKMYIDHVYAFTRLRFSFCDRVFHADFLTSDRQDHYIKYSCNGTIVEHPEYGEVMQLSGDQRQQIKDFLVNVGIVKEENCKVHGF